MELFATENPHILVLRLAGAAQTMLAAGSLLIPRLLQWKSELSKTSVLIKQIFWTYAAYILVINISFGLVSFFACGSLIDGSLLATTITGFIAVYWISRLGIQFLYFDRANFPEGKLYAAGETLLVTLFIALSAVYTYVFLHNVGVQ